MTFHDAYPRVTPYELAFPDREFARERLDRLRVEAEERGQAADLVDPGRFLALPGVAELLHDIRDPRAGADALQKHGVLLYHIFHFEEAGRPLYLLETHVARHLVEFDSSGDGGAASTPPRPAGYVQLPRQLFWIRPSEEGPPEPVDGLFWSAPDGERLAVLVAAGIREDRPGFSVVPLPAVPLDESEAWLHEEIRPEGRDFESTLPGGELQRLYSLEAAGEVLKLLARLFRYLDLFPDAVRPEIVPEEAAVEGSGAGARPEDAPEGARGEPGEKERPVEESAEHDGASRPSQLPYRRITLETRSDDGD